MRILDDTRTLRSSLTILSRCVLLFLAFFLLPTFAPLDFPQIQSFAQSEDNSNVLENPKQDINDDQSSKISNFLSNIHTGGMTIQKMSDDIIPSTGIVLTSDGKYSVEVNWDTGNLVLKNLQTKENKNLTTKGSWDDPVNYVEECILSPDDETVVYSWYNGGNKNYEIRLVEIDGSNDRLLYKSDKYDWLGSFEWDNSEQVFCQAWIQDRPDINSQIDLLFINPLNGKEEIVHSFSFQNKNVSNFITSPSHNYLAYSIGDNPDYPNDIYLFDIKKQLTSCIVDHPANDRIVGWSQDEKWFVFISNRMGSDSIWAIDVSNTNAKKSPILLKQDIGQTLWNSTLSSDESFYYFEKVRFSDVFLAKVDLEKGIFIDDPISIGNTIKLPCKTGGLFSPDGNNLAFGATSDFSSRRHFVYSIQDGSIKEINHLLLRGGIWNWTLDSQNIIGQWTNSPYGHENYALYKINVQTGEPIVIIPKQKNIQPGGGWYTKDRKSFLYLLKNLQTNNETLILHDPATQEEMELLFISSSDIKAGEEFEKCGDISIDQRYLALSVKAFAKIDNEKRETLWILDSYTKEIKNVLQLDKEKSFKFIDRDFVSDNNSIFAIIDEPSPKQNTLWKIPINGQLPQKLITFPFDVSFFDIHPDGKQMCFNASTIKPQVWKVENFLPDKEDILDTQ